MKVVELRADEQMQTIVRELVLGCGSDLVMQVDCASEQVAFVVAGWFVFPKDSLSHSLDIPSAS